MSRVMGELRSRVGISQHGPKYLIFNALFTRFFCLDLRAVCPSSIPCHVQHTYVLFPTGDDIEPMSDAMLFTMKLKEKGELTKELQLMTSQRNKLQERLISITEGIVDNRYPSFQTSWGCRQCHHHLLSFWVLASTLTSDLRF